MASGGGYFVAQNKILPGSYVNFVSVARAASALSDRGVGTMPLVLDWGIDETVFAVTNDEFAARSKAIFGYDYLDPKLKGLRDFFKNAVKGYFYKLNKGTKASNTFATAKHSGIRGNDITVVIQTSIDDAGSFDVSTLLDGKALDAQTVASAADLKSNDYVDFKTDATLTATAGMPLSGGSNGEAVTGGDHQEYLTKIEPYSFNTMGCLSQEKTVHSLYIAFQKRMREEVGAKFQTVLFRADKADYEGIISVDNPVLDAGEDVASAVYWVTGAECGVAVNKTLENQVYNGEFEIEAKYDNLTLAQGIQNGKFMFHTSGDETVVLKDINTFVSFVPVKNSDFNLNQVIRVLDQIAIDIARIFNKQYMGKVQNVTNGRISLWNSITKQLKELEKISAIDTFDTADVTIEKGDLKDSVVVGAKVTPAVAMSQLYMTVAVA